MRYFWIPLALALSAFAVVFAVQKAPAQQPLSPAACRTMDEIFRPTGVAGKEQLLRHLIAASDKLAQQTSGDLREAAEIHASYVRLLSTDGEIPESTHAKGLKAYDTIRSNAARRCALPYLVVVESSAPARSVRTGHT